MNSQSASAIHTPSIEDLRAVSRAVAEAAGLRLVVLFGSTARGEARARDVDLGLLGAAPLDLVDMANRFTVALHRDNVDLVDLRRANPVLLMSVACDGIPLFEATGTEFYEFASLAMRRYADTKKFRDAVREDLRDFVSRGERKDGE